MKILHLISSLNPSYGGPVEGVLQLARSYSDFGHTVEIATMDPPDSPWLKNLGIKIHFVGPRYFTFAFAPKLRVWLEGHADEYDAVVIEGLWQYLGYVARVILMKYKIPYFVFTHGQLGNWFKREYPIKHLKKYIYWLAFESRNLQNATAVFYTSEEERKQSQKSFWPYRVKEVVVGYGTDTPPGNSKTQLEFFFQKYPSLSKKRILLFVGRINKQKACDLLIKAFSEVARDDDDLHLVMVGPDQDKWQANLIELSNKLGLQSRISWLGMLSGDMKWGAYHSAECFVLPSHHESFGVVVAEALSCSLPVLISNKVNIYQEVQNSDAGFISDDEIDGYIFILRKWLSLSEFERIQIRANALSCFQKNFYIKSTVKMLVSTIEGSVN